MKAGIRNLATLQEMRSKVEGTSLPAGRSYPLVRLVAEITMLLVVTGWSLWFFVLP